jgi:hypothetical protein
MMKVVVLICCMAMLVGISGCKVYSFTGASVPADVKTVTIEQIRNLASNVTQSDDHGQTQTEVCE